MCAVSFVGDAYRRHFDDVWPAGPMYPSGYVPRMPYGPTQAEFDTLRAKVEEMIALLKAAKQFDVLTKQADCAMDEKIDFLRQVAALVGVDLDQAAFNAPKAAQ